MNRALRFYDPEELHEDCERILRSLKASLDPAQRRILLRDFRRKHLRTMSFSELETYQKLCKHLTSAANEYEFQIAVDDLRTYLTARLQTRS